MPNAKSGTVGPNIGEIVSDRKKGQIEYRNEPKAAVVHSIVGKSSFEADALVENTNALDYRAAIVPNRRAPKAPYLRTVTLSSTMGPGVKVDAARVAPAFNGRGDFPIMVAKKYKDKEALVEELREKLSQATAVVVTEYRGLKAGDLVTLRSGLREANVELRIVKNTLAAPRHRRLAVARNDAVACKAPSAVALAFGEADRSGQKTR